MCDSVLGARSTETRAAFISQLHQECSEASPEDSQWLVSKPSNADPAGSSGPQLFRTKTVAPAAQSAPAVPHDPRSSSRMTIDSSSQSLDQTVLCFACGRSALPAIFSPWHVPSAMCKCCVNTLACPKLFNCDGHMLLQCTCSIFLGVHASLA